MSATAASSSQINLAWTASTDNIGVKSYDIYRGTGSATPTKVATVTTTSFGDAGLSASTSYSYYVVATDAAGNNSAHSSTVSATTLTVVTAGTIAGTVSNNQGGVIVGASVSVTVGGVQHTTTTNTNGAYALSGLPAATYSVQFNAKHFKNQTLQVAVTAGVTTIQNVTLIHR